MQFPGLVQKQCIQKESIKMMYDVKELIDKLVSTRQLKMEEWMYILKHKQSVDRAYVYEMASKIRNDNYGCDVYLRGLIEISNYCKRDCLYCGIRRSNKGVERYRLDKEDILACCEVGYELGLRTFVMQGGEDTYYSDALLVDMIQTIKLHYPDCAITLSLGERSKESYKMLYDAGVDRYLLRHESANAKHYSYLHPKEDSLQTRLHCLNWLKEIGYQVGCGFMVGSPQQSVQSLCDDFMLLQSFQPDMVGIGPFIPHHATPFASCDAGSVEDTLLYLALVRILLPNVLLPATTALRTMHEGGFQKGMKVGCNVIMPNLTPSIQRAHYNLYDNKNGTSVHEIQQIKEEMFRIGYQVVESRGDHLRVRGVKNERN